MRANSLRLFLCYSAYLHMTRIWSWFLTELVSSDNGPVWNSASSRACSSMSVISPFGLCVSIVGKKSLCIDHID